MTGVSAQVGARAARASRSANRAAIDPGRLVMVPVAMLMLVLDATLGRPTGGSHSSLAGVLGWAGTLLVCAFYGLIIWCYLRRGKATATSPSVSASVVAIAATFMPFILPWLAGVGPGAGRQLASDLLLVVGTTWSVWSLRHLGRNLSVIAQARGVSEQGPYRWVRHPLYVGEIVSSLGLAIAVGTAAAAAVWVALVAMQVYRAAREEQVLLVALPGYRDYRARTAALLPGIF